ncbi:MAG TPA: phosphotransferase family protein [Ilumatobacteraceae bacterium]|nr:phosphotransferase family protein [Ilumatobacteraceae bacterium]
MNETLVDRDALQRWLDAHDGDGLGRGQTLQITPLTSGFSNAMFRVTRGAHQWVLRRPAKVALARANEAMAREFRLLHALDHTDVAHPRTVALCEDHDVLGCTFYLMEAVDGFNPIEPLPTAFATLPDARRRVTFSVIDALARLHEVDWRAAGLDGFGRPQGFHERQVARWIAQFDSYGGREIPELHQTGEWLNRHIPSQFEPTLMHADYHMFNILVAPEPPARVAAIVDWETASIGDPLLDAVGLTEIWCPSHPQSTGWPSASEMLERYATQRSISLPDNLGYYVALYNFRMAILLEGIHQRSLTDPTRPNQVEVGEQAMKHAVAALAATGG